LQQARKLALQVPCVMVGVAWWCGYAGSPEDQRQRRGLELVPQGTRIEKWNGARRRRQKAFFFFFFLLGILRGGSRPGELRGSTAGQPAPSSTLGSRNADVPPATDEKESGAKCPGRRPGVFKQVFSASWARFRRRISVVAALSLPFWSGPGSFRNNASARQAAARR
jgi:hypothetical protein